MFSREGFVFIGCYVVVFIVFFMNSRSLGMWCAFLVVGVLVLCFH